MTRSQAMDICEQQGVFDSIECGPVDAVNLHENLHDALQQVEDEGYRLGVAAQSAHCVAVIEDLERKAMAESQRVSGVIVAAERERCAKIADQAGGNPEARLAGIAIAIAIRSGE